MSTGTPGKIFMARFNTLPLGWGNLPISGTVRGQVSCRQTYDGDNSTLAFKLTWTSGYCGNTAGANGLLMTPTYSTTAGRPPEMAVGTYTSRQLLDSSDNPNVALTTVTTKNMRIALALGFYNDGSPAEAGARALRSSASLPGFEPGDNTSTQDLGSWIEFSQALWVCDFDYYGSSWSTPPDNDATGVADAATSTITPPASMQSGDLCIVAAHVGNATTGNVTVSNAGGQTWNTAIDTAPGNDTNLVIFWCQFNGTWSANPAFACGSLSGTQPFTCGMEVFRVYLPSGSYTWALDAAATSGALSAPVGGLFRFTISGPTTSTLQAGGGFLAYCVIGTQDDNPYDAPVGSDGADAQWFGRGLTNGSYCRNLAGADCSTVSVWCAEPKPNTTIEDLVVAQQQTVGADSGAYAMAVFRLTQQSMLVEASPRRAIAPMVVR